MSDLHKIAARVTYGHDSDHFRRRADAITRKPHINHIHSVTEFRYISMPAGFRRHLLGKTLDKLVMT